MLYDVIWRLVSKRQQCFQPHHLSSGRGKPMSSATWGSARPSPSHCLGCPPADHQSLVGPIAVRSGPGGWVNLEEMIEGLWVFGFLVFLLGGLQGRYRYRVSTANLQLHSGSLFLFLLLTCFFSEFDRRHPWRLAQNVWRNTVIWYCNLMWFHCMIRSTSIESRKDMPFAN